MGRNNDSLWGGIDSSNKGKFKDGYDNLQQFNVTWAHRCNEAGTVLTSTEAYYMDAVSSAVQDRINYHKF